MKRWKHARLQAYDYASLEPRGFYREVPESDYRKIMAVYRAAVNYCNGPEPYNVGVDAIYRAVEKAEK